MNQNSTSELKDLLDHGDLDAVLAWWLGVAAAQFPGASFSHAERVFSLTHKLFSGNFPGYAACRTAYHDFRHTVDVFVATVRLLDGMLLSGATLSRELVEDTMIAALLHDTGYVQEADDTEGTGAKYTATHVGRSVEFLLKNRGVCSLPPERTDRVGRLIMGTDLSLPWDSLALAGSEEATAAAVLAAADLLGQMADRVYLEKLLFLYYEFKEAGIGGYESAFDILRKTAGFYSVVKKRLDETLAPVAAAARVHFRERLGLDRDLYRESIVNQMSYLDSILDDDSVNFRKRLRRMDMESADLDERRRLASYGVAAAMDT